MVESIGDTDKDNENQGNAMTAQASAFTRITSCKECGSKDLHWHTVNGICSDVQKGRLRTTDVQCLFVLGCNFCSETLATATADQVASLLNKSLSEDEVSTCVSSKRS